MTYDGSGQGSVGSAVAAPIGNMMVSYINPAFEWIRVNWVEPVANVLYVLLMLWAFLELPLHASLALGLATFLIGPAFMEAVLQGSAVEEGGRGICEEGQRRR